jgi:ribonuclease-3
MVRPEQSDPDFEPALELCEQRVGYTFKNKGLLREAFTHASGAEHRLASNERLEFLGDAILGCVVCEMLYRDFTDALEGELTKIKSVVVSRQTCAKLSVEMGLDEFLILGKGMINHESVPMSLLAGVFESLVAAIFLDGGHDAVRKFLSERLIDEIETVAESHDGGNYKSLLQQVAQRDFNMTPTYRLRDEDGPDHSKYFQISARIGDRDFQAAWGRNKKSAEQKAARNALYQIRGEDPPYSPETKPD